VILEGDHNDQLMTMSGAVMFPTQFVEKTMKQGFDTKTIGFFLSKELGCNSKDPHQYLTHNFVTRIELLEQTIIILIGQLMTYIPNIN